MNVSDKEARRPSLVLGQGAQGQGEETLAPAGALTPVPGGPLPDQGIQLGP